MLGADDAGGDGAGEALGVADGDDRVADRDGGGVAEHGGGELLGAARGDHGGVQALVGAGEGGVAGEVLAGGDDGPGRVGDLDEVGAGAEREHVRQGSLGG